MKIYHYGLHYNERSRHIELVTYGVFTEPDAAYTPEWLRSLLVSRTRLDRSWLNRDILASLNNKGYVSAFYFVQNGAQTYGLFSQRLTLLYALLSFRGAFVFVHYKADASRLPTEKDQMAYHRLAKAFSSLSLELHDFLIIGSDGFYSYRAQYASESHPCSSANLSTAGDRAA